MTLEQTSPPTPPSQQNAAKPSPGSPRGLSDDEAKIIVELSTAATSLFLQHDLPKQIASMLHDAIKEATEYIYKGKTGQGDVVYDSLMAAHTAASDSEFLYDSLSSVI